MTEPDLDQAYSAVCEALSQVGEARTPLFLSMLCLSLMSRFERADQVQPLIANALAQSEKASTHAP
ncbi:hypothetical protein [Hydrogenophaga sp. 2FB]|uniref:hypothetical protein n=1 Tax=Hydrogenophaga sp. 2FB TaxID=2502187 RepID=UPI0010F8234B|nr:hypothetical protein [Hydrogenophaga sp. 2FB]